MTHNTNLIKTSLQCICDIQVVDNSFLYEHLSIVPKLLKHFNVWYSTVPYGAYSASIMIIHYISTLKMAEY